MAEILEIFKQWGQRFLEKSRAPRSFRSALWDLEGISQENSDPRELPRPARPSGPLCLEELQAYIDHQTPNQDSTRVLQKTDECCKNGFACVNCKELTDNLVNCVVCVEPLQGVKIFSCYHCGNVICWKCVERVHLCPFCRCEVRRDASSRNQALENVLARLALPCRNARWGCKEFLHLEDRVTHEISCQFTLLGCPWQRDCGWQGDAESVVVHLKKKHNITVLPASGITIEISHFRSKMIASDQKVRKYTVPLSCFASVFVCKVSLCQRKLRITFTRISDGTDIAKFGAWLQVTSSFRTLRGIMPISSQSTRTKALDVSCESLVSPWKKTDETVVVDITIRPIT
ncbi:uncharacterized protein [Anabrus simplex]|uniref:uncharacterized protein n=1 Tax=Anabrus simplex TaxID=316456 RepID=UPI0035A34E45